VQETQSLTAINTDGQPTSVKVGRGLHRGLQLSLLAILAVLAISLQVPLPPTIFAWDGAL
jgi:hypothetical protein